jgi:hypothetical protein
VEGGVVYADFDSHDGQVTLDNDSISATSNTADLAAASTPSAEESYIDGGVIYSADSDLSISSTPITSTTDTASGGNGEVYGGEFYLEDTFANLTNVNMTGAAVTADDYIAGGLWYNYDGTQSDLKDVTLGSASVTTLGGSDASDGGDVDGSIVYNDTNGTSGANMNIVNGTFDDVTSSVPANADYVWAFEMDTGESQFTNTTIANDSLTTTGNTALIGMDGGELSMLNTIVASTTPAQNCVIEDGAIVSAGHNLDSGSSCNFTEPGDISNANPQVQSLANNGGQVLTGALAAGSPAIDAGTNHGCPNADARGVPRPQGSSCDIGAYEYVHQGYWMDASDGGIFSFGNAQFYGSMGGKPLNKPVVGMAATSDGRGYWLVASDGGIFNYGDASFGGSMGGKPLNAPMVGVAGMPDNGGYWTVASDGGIFTFGDAQFYGSMGGQHLNKPIVGMAATPDGGGYWLVASDGGIFSFGDAKFYGSTGSLKLNKPVVGMASSPDGRGYWLVASDGGIFNYGDAGFYGSTGSLKLNKPVVGMGASPSGNGYFLFASDGGVFNYGDAIFQGSMGGTPLNKPVVGGATTGVMPSAGAL